MAARVAVGGIGPPAAAIVIMAAGWTVDMDPSRRSPKVMMVMQPVIACVTAVVIPVAMVVSIPVSISISVMVADVIMVAVPGLVRTPIRRFAVAGAVRVRVELGPRVAEVRRSRARRIVDDRGICHGGTAAWIRRRLRRDRVGAASAAFPAVRRLAVAVPAGALDVVAAFGARGVLRAAGPPCRDRGGGSRLATGLRTEGFPSVRAEGGVGPAFRFLAGSSVDRAGGLGRWASCGRRDGGPRRGRSGDGSGRGRGLRLGAWLNAWLGRYGRARGRGLGGADGGARMGRARPSGVVRCGLRARGGGGRLLGGTSGFRQCAALGSARGQRRQKHGNCGDGGERMLQTSQAHRILWLHD